jgi:hypothetical protein
MQQKTQRPVQFEITEPTRKSVRAWTQEHMEPIPCAAPRHL